MPKSRKSNRKGAKKYRPKSLSGFGGESASEQEEEITPAPGLRDILFNDAETLRGVVTFLPLVIGSWIAGGIQLMRVDLFAILFGLAVVLHYLGLTIRGSLAVLKSRRGVMLLHAAGGILLGAFFFLTQAVLPTLFAFAYYAIGILRLQLQRRTPGEVLLESISLVVQMMILAMLGAYAQLESLIFPITLIGFVPGCYLAASVIASSAQVFEARDWKRSFRQTKKDGTEIFRPGALTRVFSFALVIGPLVPILLAPLGLLPSTLLLTVLPLYFMPNVATGFYESLRPDAQTSAACVRMAGMSAILLLLGALMAQV